MERFGDELRGERERRGVTIETICSLTKVSSRHLQALENNRFGDLPGGVFRKGIVRSYLSVVGLDESGWMGRFEQELRAAGLASDETYDWAEFAVNVKRNRPGRRQSLGMRWLGVLAMLALLGLLTWAAWQFVLEPRLRL